MLHWQMHRLKYILHRNKTKFLALKVMAAKDSKVQKQALNLSFKGSSHLFSDKR